jgi:hypothetical protein
MMFALLLASVESAPVAGPAEDDIIVIGNKLNGWKGKVSDTIGIRRCRTTQSTGDKEIDAIGCRVLTDCFVPMKPRMIAAAKAAGRDKEKRGAALAPLNAEMTKCFKERRTALITELLDRRAIKRSEAGL